MFLNTLIIYTSTSFILVRLTTMEGIMFQRIPLKDTGTSMLLLPSVFFTRPDNFCDDSIEMHKASIAEFEWPTGTYWVGVQGKKQ